MPVRYALLALTVLTLAACNPGDCSRGAFLGGGAGTAACTPDHYYAPRFLPEQELRPYLDAVYRDADRRGR